VVGLYNVGPNGEQLEIPPIGGREVTGGSYPVQIWTAYMQKALEGTEVQSFPPRADVGSIPASQRTPTFTPTPTPEPTTEEPTEEPTTEEPTVEPTTEPPPPEPTEPPTAPPGRPTEPGNGGTLPILPPGGGGGETTAP